MLKAEVLNKKLNDIWCDLICELDLWIRSCAACGSFWGKTDLFCSGCWQELKQEQKEKLLSKGDYPFKSFSLWQWDERSSDLLKDLIYSLKGGGLKRAYEHLAELLSLRLYEEEPSLLKQKVIFVPAPAKRGCEQDHAYILAKSLAKFWQASFAPVLLRTNENQQKSLDRQERKKVSHQLKSTDWSYNGDELVVFVDDLITTGATAQAAYMALGTPKNFHICTLAERSLLLQKSVFDKISL